MTPERRYFQQAPKLETRADAKGSTISGYAAVFYDGTPETEFVMWPGMVERFLPGAFDETVKADDIRCLFNHDPSLILGRTKSKTLVLSIDSRGLAYVCTPPDAPNGQNAMAAISRGDVDGSSIGMIVQGEDWTEDKVRGVIIRSIAKVQLFDASPVVYPAYAGTSSEVRECRSLLDARVQATLGRNLSAELRRLEIQRLGQSG